MGLCATQPHAGPRDPALRRARVCYDHLAGAAAVALLDRLRAGEFLRGVELTSRGEAWAARTGIDLPALRSERRALVRTCLDWSERRDHLAGALGAAILTRLFALRLARRDPLSRAVSLSPRGEAFLRP